MIESLKITGTKITEIQRNTNPLNATHDAVVLGLDLEVSDGYHTMAELYDHRITLWIALCKQLAWSGTIEGANAVIPVYEIWRSKLHHDGGSYPKWFVLGIGKEKNSQLTYHVPLKRWDETSFAEELERAPEWDGHTANDVLGRLKLL